MQEVDPELHAEVLRMEGRKDRHTGFRTILLSPAYSYSMLTAARGFLSPFQLPRSVGWICSCSLAVQAPKYVFKSSVTPKVLSVSRSALIAPLDYFDTDD